MPVAAVETALGRLAAILAPVGPQPCWATAGAGGWERYTAETTETPDRRKHGLPPTAGLPVPRPAAAAESAEPDGEGTDAGRAPGPGAAPDGTGADDATVVALLHAAQHGDAEAFGQLYDRYVTLVYRYVYYRVADAPLAEDLTSETFLRALRRISSFTWQGRDFGAWLVTIARNLVADHRKSARFRLELPTADMLGTGAERRADGPEGQVVDALMNAALLDAVRQLGPEQQECVVLRFFEGLSVAETALVMDRNAGAVKALQYRAMRSLSRLLPAELRP